jgi:(S)-2-hydroxyglutarate dehydrogenase
MLMGDSSNSTPVSGHTHDLLIIGGGIVGLASAMTLATRHRLSVCVLEAEDRIASHQTGNNSGVIHSGLYYKPGSLKAGLCAQGRTALYRFCAEQGIRHERCGKLVVATEESELPRLEELERRGRANGLAGLRRLNADELRQREPHVRGIAGLLVEETGIVDYVEVAEAYARILREHDGRILTGHRVHAVRSSDNEIVAETSQGPIKGRYLLNCAGLQSDRVARLCGVSPDVQIVPFRGEYYKLSPQAARLVRHLIYPVPDPRFPFLGVHFTRMARGGVEAGPNAVLALARHGYSRWSLSVADTWEIARFPGFWRMAAKYWRTGLGESYRSFSKRAFLKALRRLIPDLALADLLPGGAGVRAQALERSGALVDDFRIETGQRMIHVLNAPSPAATGSLSIGAYIADEAAKSFDLPS